MAVLSMLPVRKSNLRGSAARSRDPVQPSSQLAARSEEDDAVFVPGASTAGLRIAKRLHRAARDVHPLKPALSKEPERPAIGRPEGKVSAIGIRDAGRFPRSRLIDPQQAFSFRLSAHHRNRVAIGRHR